MNTEEKLTLPLSHPITIDDGNGNAFTLNEVKIGRMKTKHLKLLPSDFMKKKGQLDPMAVIPLLSGLAGLSEDAIGEIDIVDLVTISEALEGFLLQGVKSLQTGKK